MADELILHTITGGWGLPSISPFCLKLDTYLRMVERNAKVVVDATPFKAPKRKLPYIEYGGRVIGDSDFIIQYLNDKFGYDLNRDLTPAEKAIALGFRRLCEENLYWVMVYDRWMLEENWSRTKELLLGAIPTMVRPLVAIFANRGVRQELVGHGIGRHSSDEIHQIGIRDLNALADFLGDKPFFMGSAPTEIDATVYGQVSNILQVPIETPVKVAGLKRPNLLDYCERMRNRFF